MRLSFLILALVCGSAVLCSAAGDDEASWSGLPGGSDDAFDASLEASSTRKLASAGPMLLMQALGGSGGSKRYRGTIVGQGLVTDPACTGDAYICFNTLKCKRVPSPRRALQSTTLAQANNVPGTNPGSPADVAAQQMQSTCFATQLTGGASASTAQTRCQTAQVLGTSDSQRRRRSLLAAQQDGQVFLYQAILTGTGTEGDLRPGFQSVLDAFNSGALDLCQGYSFVPGKAAPGPEPAPLKPIQRYTALVGISAKGASCSAWSTSAKRAYVRCASSLTGQPVAYASATCSQMGRTLNPNKNKLVIRVGVGKTGTGDQAQAMLNALAAHVVDGSFATCVKSQGLQRYLPKKLESSQLIIGNPKKTN